MWSPRPAPIPSQMYQIALERVTISKLCSQFSWFTVKQAPRFIEQMEKQKIFLSIILFFQLLFCSIAFSTLIQSAILAYGILCFDWANKRSYLYVALDRF